MPRSKAHAVVVVPAAALRRGARPAVVRWLSRATVRRDAMPALDLTRALAALGLAAPAAGHAALRLWGQVGQRPGVWVAAADPVFLEARLDDVHLHALSEGDVATSELTTLYDDLQVALFEGTASSLVRIGRCGYLRGEEIATASVPPAQLDGRRIDDYLPAGAAPGLATNGEIQMSLHQHPLNSARAERGALPVNALWLWGGGRAPAADDVRLPPLASADPLFVGHWLNHGAAVSGPDLSAVTEDPRRGLVATFDDDTDDDTDGERLGEALATLRERMRSGTLARLTLVRSDGVTAELGALDRWRFWRSNADGVFGAVE